jgi:hydroxyacid-oxoacid transhydrogenase
VIDTAKAANLCSTYPADVLACVTKPIGEGRPVPGPLKPLIAVPTTSGTGSETTGNAALDYPEVGTKTAIAHGACGSPRRDRPGRRARPAAEGHRLFRARRALPRAGPVHRDPLHNQRPAPEKPHLRTPYQGSNPVVNIWAAEAIRIGARHLVEVVIDPEAQVARGQHDALVSLGTRGVRFAVRIAADLGSGTVVGARAFA